MTVSRMIELLKIEHECMLRNSHDDCDRNCADCDLVQDDYEVEYSDVESPTLFFKQALVRAEDHELVIPVTRNMFVRDRLRQEGVNLIVCL